MNAGSIVGCIAELIYGVGDGGGVYVGNGSFTMDAGSIVGCTAESSGGGVYVGDKAVLTMNGGVIEKCTAKWCGGGVSVADSITGGGKDFAGEFNMKGGTIIGNKAIVSNRSAAYGGGVFVSAYSTLVMTKDAYIIENESEASCGCGGVSVWGKADVTNVYNNISYNGADDIFASNSATLTLGNIDENAKLPCGHKITGWYEDGNPRNRTSRWGRHKNSGQEVPCFDEKAYYKEVTATESTGVWYYLKAAHGAAKVTWLDGFGNDFYHEVDVKYVEQGSTVVPEDLYPAAPEVEGWAFTGWGKPEVDDDGNITIEAQWTLGAAQFILAEKEASPYEADNTEPNDGTVDGAIVVTSGLKDIPLTNFTGATFEINNDNTNVLYEIVPKDDFALIHREGTNKYTIYVNPENGKEPHVSETNAKDGIVIGYIKYQGGYGNGAIKAENVTVTTESSSDNLLTKITNIDTWDFKYDIKEKTQKLTVTVEFNNSIVTDNAADYEKMDINVYSARTGNIQVRLGNDVKLLDEAEIKAGIVGVESFKIDANKKYTVVLANLPADTQYTVSIKGDGYRTAKTGLNLNENKTVLFWNNAKDELASYVTTANGGVEQTTKTNFLAGDITNDNIIDLYDLSAVSTYFGRGMDTVMTADAVANADFIKYDINRDGVVDILDIAMVIVGWTR